MTPTSTDWKTLDLMDAPVRGERDDLTQRLTRITRTSTDRKTSDLKDAPVRGKHDHLTQRIISVFYDVYNELGAGFLEIVYREAMRLALLQAGLAVEAEVSIPVTFRGQTVGVFRADLVVNRAVLIELKATEALAREHQTQTLNYLKATQIEVALLMNFGPVPRFKRLVMDNASKAPMYRSAESVPVGIRPFAQDEVAL